ncbi:ATP-dependent helicase [Sulfuracidifex metallicus]|uniref:ATP-dependent helicase n=1 Tax=Sulfuracidifex metallicus DSM 6482 = JCM 9184 TaxID=523847 RepID=A0A6A9QIE5_SULME|nr:ATP-dependent helicase [Sulfuracidifex metallicus]MUN28756.1 ATP-dependent helicase [Sulfuracidifex metallicus DSM 6482 = JCM 9184]
MTVNYAKFEDDETVFSILRPYVASWFKEKYGSFTPPQKASIPLIKKGMNVLVSSPTGSGKTLSAFLGILDTLFELGEEGKLEDKVYAIYISPLRALNNDMKANLLSPLNELKEKVPRLPQLRIGVRTSDTSSYEKQKMVKLPPHILITTPESFAISMVSPKFSQNLQDVRWIIVDEIHEIAGSKRGSYLSSMLEIFQNLIAKNKVTRIGLSATVSPLEDIAKFLVGKNNDCQIIDARFVKPVDLKVISPVRDLVHESESKIEEGIYNSIIEEVQKHRTTLIFTNTRHAAENVSYKLRKIAKLKGILSEDAIEAHHSSLSKDVRLEVEEKLKRGELKVVISSTSLELGIDIGYIDVVILLSSPKSVSRLLQRIGRAGHHIRSISKGRMIVVDRDDLVECSVLAELAREKKIDAVHIPRNPLDVLSQAIIAATIVSKGIHKNKLYEILSNSYSYSTLSEQDYELVLNYLLGEYGLEQRNVYSKISLDKEGNIKPKGSMRMIFYMNSGTIPDEAVVPVMTENSRYVGNLEEEFVEMLTPGDVFVLGGRTYQFLSSKGLSVIVRPAEGQRPTVPSWFSEMLPLAYESAVEIGKFRRTVKEMIESGISREEIVDWISKSLKLNKYSSISLYYYILEMFYFTNGIIPSDKLVLIEIFDDEEGRRNFIFHAIFGRRALDAISRGVAQIVTKDLKEDVKLSVLDNGFIITIPKKIDYDISSVFQKLKLETFYEELSDVILRTEMMRRRFRHSAERSFMLLRRYKGRKTNLERRQINSEVLLGIVKELGGFPVLKETIREILEDHMDITRAMEVLEKIQNNEIELKVIGPNSIPSPFSHSMLLKEHYDVVLAEDKRQLLKKLHESVVEFLREKGIDVNLDYTSV